MQGFGRRALGGLAGFALAAHFGEALAQAPAPEVRLGAIFPLSGPLALFGDECFRGVELAVEERNAAGGVSGRTLRLLGADAPDEATATNEARRLTRGDGRVAALLGSFGTSIALPASQVAELAGVPFIELAALGDAVTERGFRWVFRISPSATDYAATAVAGVALLAQAIGRPPQSMRLAIAHEDAPASQSVGAAQQGAIAALGFTQVQRAAYAPRPTDLNGLVQRLRGVDAEVVLHTGAPGDEALLFRAMAEVGWRPRMVIGTANGYGLVETGRSIGPGLTGTMSADLTPSGVNERMAGGARAFAEAYLRRYGAEPRSGHGLATFTGTRVVLDAMARAGGTEAARAGGTEAERIRTAILATDIAEGATACGWGVRFDERGQNQRARPFLCQWQPAPPQPGNPAGLRQVVIAPADAAIADAITRLGA
ncbi:ABC transporter substrate-binding protein [Falsiroseomonas sp. HC035]|uniref:ABC transporter substrate-binding protein n=1 Tax=Falsiroseomonas sp. HC035 TaxID=3390999 RepID=UPI003D3227D3